MFKVHEITPAAHAQDIWAVAWRGNTLATGSLDQSVRLWRPGVSKEPQTLKGHTLAVVSVDVSSEGRLVASSGLDAVVAVYDGATGKQLQTIKAPPGEAYAVRFAPVSNGGVTRLAASSKTGAVSEWDAEKGTKLRTFEAGAGKFATCVGYAPDASLIAAGSVDGALSVWDAGEEGKRLLRTEAHAKAIRAVSFAPDCALVASASDDAHVRLWDARHASLVHSFSGHRGPVLGVACSSAGKYMASSSADGTVKIWDVASRQCVYTFAEHKAAVWAVAFDDTGKRLVSVGDDALMIQFTVL